MEHMFRHNVSLSKKIRELQSVYRYNGWRRVRGDGNCYYRAVLFGLIEGLIISNQRARLERLAQCFEKVCFEDAEEQKQHISMVQRVRDAASEPFCWQTTWDFEAEMLRSESQLDAPLIRACRRLVGQFILDHASDQFNGIELQVAIMASHSEVLSLQDYVREYIFQLGVDAEGSFLQLGVLFSALACHGRTVFLDRRADVAIKIMETPQDPNSDVSAPMDPQDVDVHLLLRPGHYDLLYHSLFVRSEERR
jgi:hypothetical protein